MIKDVTIEAWFPNTLSTWEIFYDKSRILCKWRDSTIDFLVLICQNLSTSTTCSQIFFNDHKLEMLELGTHAHNVGITRV